MKRFLITAAVVAGTIALLKVPSLSGVASSAEKVRRSFLSRTAASEAPAAAQSPTHQVRETAAVTPRDENVVGRIKRLKACFDHSCNYPDKEPRDYEFALEADIAGELLEMASDARGGGRVSEEYSEAAREFLASTNGNLQLAALAVMSAQPESPRNLEAILKGAILGSNADSTETALNELRRYQDPRDKDTIAEFLSEAIARGSPLIAAEVAANILPFIAPTNAARLAEFARTLPTDSHLRAQLEASIEEFYRLAEGG